MSYGQAYFLQTKQFKSSEILRLKQRSLMNEYLVGFQLSLFVRVNHLNRV